MILQEWLEAKIKPGLNVLHVGKRIKPFQHWEPIYIGTNQVRCRLNADLIKSAN